MGSEMCIRDRCWVCLVWNVDTQGKSCAACPRLDRGAGPSQAPAHGTNARRGGAIGDMQQTGTRRAETGSARTPRTPMRGTLSPEKGQNMIGTLARKRTNVRLSHLTALAVMVALVGGLLVALSSIGAQAAEPKVGDIAVPTTTPATSVTSAPAGFCVDPDPDVDTDQPIVRTTQVVGGVAIQVYAPDNSVDDDPNTAGHQDDTDDALDLMDIECLAADHEKRVSVSPNGTTTPNVTVSDPNALLLLGRSVVSNDKSSEVSLRLLVLNFATNDEIVDATPGGDTEPAATPGADTAEVDWIRVSGVLDGVDDFDESTSAKDNLEVTWLSAATGFADMDLTQKIVVPKGTPEGEYTITARIIFCLLYTSPSPRDS